MGAAKSGGDEVLIQFARVARLRFGFASNANTGHLVDDTPLAQDVHVDSLGELPGQ